MAKLDEFKTLNETELSAVEGGVKWVPVGTALCPNGVISPRCKPDWNLILQNAAGCFSNGVFANFGVGGCGRPH